jgi:hypothetical protein
MYCLFKNIATSEEGGPIMQPEHDPDNSEVIRLFLYTSLFQCRGHPEASHFPKWVVLHVKRVVLKLKMNSSIFKAKINQISLSKRSF